MYATINLPGSTHFEYSGPASRKECEDWLEEKKIEHQEKYGGVWVSTYFPARVVSNKDVLKWTYRDGTKVVRPLHEY